MDKDIVIRKGNGEEAVFDEGKLRHSLERSGAGEDLIDQVVRQIEAGLYPGMPTRLIYQQAFSLLRKRSRPSASRYKLRQAILELGPSGYPFERFVGALLKHQGYSVQIDVVVRGRCAAHEVDVVAEKEKKRYLVECKFHSDRLRKCTIQVPLYIHSRFLDVQEMADGSGIFHQGWIVTNTRFSEDAVQYGECAGLRLVGWDHPQHGSLRERIDTSNLHPLTCLTTLRKTEKQALLNSGVVLCKEITGEAVLSAAHIDPGRYHRILREVELFMG